MTPTQIATLLAYISSIDGRHTSTLMAEAWSDLIGGLDFEDAKSAVKDHYRDSADWLKPAHIVAGVKRIRAARIREVERHVLDGHLTLRPADYGTPAEGSRRCGACGAGWRLGGWECASTWTTTAAPTSSPLGRRRWRHDRPLPDPQGVRVAPQSPGTHGAGSGRAEHPTTAHGHDRHDSGPP
jgi:hypothetical protein